MIPPQAFLGVDPGLNGAVACMRGSIVQTYDMPTLRVQKRGKKGKKWVKRPDVQGLHNILAGIVAVDEPVIAVVEDVHSMPKQGVVSSFTFGHVTGVMHAALAAFRIPIHLVSPGAWKRVMGLSADKDASRQRASRLFPSCAGQWARKKDDGRAEAALLAYYGSRMQ